MLGTILFLAATGSQPCDAGIILRIEDQPATCVQYASNAGVTVYGLEATEHSSNDDFPHRVFVHYGTSRVEITSSLLDTGESGYFIAIDARVNRFTLGGVALVDVAVMTLISGTGHISSVTDLFFRVEGGKLYRTATLRDTDTYHRGGWSFARQVTSELLVDREGLVWVKRNRTARGTNPDRPLTVHCRVSYAAYHLRDGLLERIGDVDAAEVRRRRATLRPIPRLENRSILPCCAGCPFGN